MNMVLFSCIINMLIISSLAMKKSVFRSQAVLDNENDPNRNTIYGQFFVFFDLGCIARKAQDDVDIIQDFVDLFTCYKPNQDVTDLYPDTIDHWIEMDQVKNCNEDDIEVEWDDYCIIGAQENEQILFFGSNQCVSRPVESALWNLNTAYPAISDSTPFIQFDSSYNPNVDIVVMDSGIDASHPQFNGITVEKIFDPYPGQSLGSHGTHCAGTILGKDYGSLRIDSDTQIKLIDVRIFPLEGGAGADTVLNGYDSIINYLEQNPGKKVIINMSFGGGNWAEFNTRLASIRSKGGISFAAAGNSNADASGFSPASSPDTITVGASDQSNNKASFSNYGNDVDIWAPGVSIKSAIVGGGSAVWQGTSMATPLVAGIAANILANNPHLDFDGIKNKLLSHAIYDVNDGLGNTNSARVQASCEEYGYTPTFTLRLSSDFTRCLDMSSSSNAYLHSCHFRANQKWKRGEADNDGYYTIISLSNNECLDSSRGGNGVVDNGDNIYVHPCHGNDNQKWKIDGGIIRNKANGGNYCLDIGDSGNNAHSWICSYTNGNQRIEFVEETEIISPYHSNECLDKSSSTNAYLHGCHGGTNQRWRRGTTDSDGYYTLISESNQECLDSSRGGNGQVDYGDNIYVHPCHNGDNQKWKIDGSLIKSKANGGNWCVDAGDTDNNAHSWSCSKTNNNQIFEFPGFSSLTGSASSINFFAWSIGNMEMPPMDEIMDDDGLTVSGGWLFPAVGVLLIINVICLIMYCCKRYNGSKKGHKYNVVDVDSETDLENPEQIAIK